MFAKTKDMTVGSPTKNILGFAVPLLFGYLFQQLYSVVDTAVVGHYLGSSALAAVGCTGNLNYLVLGFCIGVCSGFAIPVAQSFGAHDEDDLRRNVAHAVYLSAAISLFFAVLTGLMSPTLLRWCNTPEEILPESNAYMQVLFFGIPVTLLYNMSGAILRSLGDSRTPVIYLVVASLINIALDILFVLTFHTGVAGAAWATLISQLISGIGCVVTMLRHFPILRSKSDEWHYQHRRAMKLLGIGVPMGLQCSITAVGGLVLQYFVNDLGTACVAAITTAVRLGNVLACAIDTLANAMTTFAGQNLGAKKISRIGQGLRSAILLGLGYCCLTAAVIFAFGRPLLSLFVTEDGSEVLDLACQYIRVLGVSYVLVLFVNCFRFTIQGMGYTLAAVCAGVMEMIARALVGILLVQPFGFNGACFSNPMAWAFADIFLIPCYFVVIRKLKKRYESPDTANV